VTNFRLPPGAHQFRPLSTPVAGEPHPAPTPYSTAASPQSAPARGGSQGAMAQRDASSQGVWKKRFGVAKGRDLHVPAGRLGSSPPRLAQQAEFTQGHANHQLMELARDLEMRQIQHGEDHGDEIKTILQACEKNKAHGETPLSTYRSPGTALTPAETNRQMVIMRADLKQRQASGENHSADIAHLDQLLAKNKHHGMTELTGAPEQIPAHLAPKLAAIRKQSNDLIEHVEHVGRRLSQDISPPPRPAKPVPTTPARSTRLQQRPAQAQQQKSQPSAVAAPAQVPNASRPKRRILVGG
jgi:hypothetical protein